MINPSDCRHDDPTALAVPVHGPCVQNHEARRVRRLVPGRVNSPRFSIGRIIVRPGIHAGATAERGAVKKYL